MTSTGNGNPQFHHIEQPYDLDLAAQPLLDCVCLTDKSRTESCEGDIAFQERSTRLATPQLQA
jgi:hypothetical protein